LFSVILGFLSLSSERQKGAFGSGNHIIRQHTVHLQKRQRKSMLYSFWYFHTSALNALALCRYKRMEWSHNSKRQTVTVKCLQQSLQRTIHR